MKGETSTAQQCCSGQQRGMTSNKCYLDGSVQRGLGPAVVQQAGDGDAIRQVVDEGHIIDEVVCFADAEYDDGGGTLHRHKYKQTQNNVWDSVVDFHLITCGII